MTAEMMALAAQEYAALHQLRRITVVIDPDLTDVPAYVDRSTHTVAVQAGLPLEEYVQLRNAGIETLCRATVVERDDGGGTEWASDIAVGGGGPPTLQDRPSRPNLRLV